MRALCSACGHEWFEHPGAPNDYEQPTCGECDSEIEHGWRHEPACRLRFDSGLT